MKLHQRDKNSDTHAEEVDDAFGLFVNEGDDEITLDTLKKVAKVLREDVDEHLLRDMILEANGGAGVGRGVGRGEFEGVMRRAGVWR